MKSFDGFPCGSLSIVIAMLVYYPFAKAAERQRLKAEAEGKAHE